MTGFPLPGRGRAVVAAPAPGAGPGYWAGASNAALDTDGTFVVAYRVRNGHDGIDQTVVAGTPASKHWWIDVLEADDPARFQTADARPAFPGDDRTAVKDPLVRLVDGRWHAWICCHPLDVPGAEDRTSSAYATSHDGLDWEWHGTVLAGRPGKWDARGARLTSVLPDGRAAYDGRATAEENWFERTGLPESTGQGARFAPIGDSPVVDVRYLDVLPLPAGGFRIWYEARLPDESHELRTELIQPSSPA